MNTQQEVIDDQLQAKPDISIMKVMVSRDDQKDYIIFIEIINELRNKNVDGIIPGCMEILLLPGENINESYLVHPAQLPAEAAVTYSVSWKLVKIFLPRMRD
jgi:aspartate/glutamate racemase